MKKTLLSIGIVTAVVLSGCSQQKELNLGPKSVSEMMQNTEVVGWENYKDDKDEDKVPDYKDKCPNTIKGALVDENGCALDSDEDEVIDFYDKCPNTSKGVKVDKTGCPIDSDKDGVSDINDKCPNTPADIEVDRYGCALDKDQDSIADYKDKCLNTPKGAEVDENGCALDDDKDSVINLFDKCPNTPAGIVVGVDGCPVDSDKDGVADYKDKCLNTPKDVKVNFQGCPILAEYRFNFKFNSYKIDKKYYPQIQKLANILKNNKKIQIEIQGFTDNIGSYIYNKELSLKRANALRNILINRFNICPNRISVIGYGSDYPVASNATKEGQALNRRIIVIDKTNFIKLEK